MSRKLMLKTLYIPMLAIALSACDKSPNESVTPPMPLSSSPQSEDSLYGTFLTQLAQKQVIPAYEKLEQASIVFKQTVDESCADANTTKVQLATMQGKWLDLNLKWQSIQWLRLGPIKNNNLHSRLQYWPDANGAVERGVEQLFAKTISPSLSQLSQMNVGAQGLPAAEIMLFNPLYQSVDMRGKHCELLQVIATNITSMTKEVLNEWQNSSDFYSQFIAGQGEFNGVKDVFEEIFSAWLTQLTLIKDNKLLYPLGLSSPGIVALTESPHAGVSGQNIHLNLLALRGALLGSDSKWREGVSDLLMKATGDTTIAQRIHTELDNAINISAEFPINFNQQLAEQSGRQRIQKLINSLNELQDLLSVEMVLALTLNVGFNSLDGD